MGSHLFGEIKERGYTGSESLFRHVLVIGEQNCQENQGPSPKQHV
jgi:hypothetical protein